MKSFRGVFLWLLAGLCLFSMASSSQAGSSRAAAAQKRIIDPGKLPIVPHAHLEAMPMPSSCGPCREWLDGRGLLFIDDVDLYIKNTGPLDSTAGNGTFHCFEVGENHAIHIAFTIPPVPANGSETVGLMLPQGVLVRKSEGITITMKYSDASGKPLKSISLINKCHMAS